ncbi:unnamed protein product [Calypogeia fissa]
MAAAAQAPAVGTKWAPPEKVALGCVAFVVWWILAVFPAVPCLPIGRTAGSLLGAVLMVVFQVISPNAAFAAIDLPILALLFGTMLISVYLQRANMFRYLGKVLSWKSRGGKDLLCRLCVLSALCSAFFTNDTTCVVLTGFVLKLCKEKDLPTLPFLLALSSSANIGSAGTAIGNPQNLVIAVQSGIGFGKFLAGIVPAVVVGIVVNTALLLIFYWKRLSPKTNREAAGDIENGLEKELPTIGASPLEHSGQKNPESNLPQDASNRPEGSPITEIDGQHFQSAREEADGGNNNSLSRGIEQPSLPTQAVEEDPAGPLEPTPVRTLKQKLWVAAVYLITAGFLAALLAGLNLSWSAIAAAIALVVLDFTEAGPSLDKVSYSLLVFFSGMFIAVQGFNLTGAPGEFWKAMEPHSHIDNAKGLVILSLVIILLSNVASNVPTVLLLGARVAASAAMNGSSVTKAWLILAWVSTVAGNFTLLGSAANLIVSEQARTSELSYNFSLRKHLPFGIPSTLIVVAVGVPLIRG